MIDIKELRIGNIVEVYGQRVEVSAISHDMIYTKWAGANAPKFIDRVPLSNQLLIQCGFDTEDGLGTYKMPIKYIDTNHPCTLQRTGDGIQICRSGIGAITAPIIYLHQLQNLFMSLIGTELQIKL